MRIYNRTEFMKLPEGTLYAKGQPWYFGDICVKGETVVWDGVNGDWYVHSFNWVDSDDTGVAIDRLNEMKDNGASYPMQDSICRDGMFDNDDLFLVYEQDDLERLKGFVDRAIGMCKNTEGDLVE